VDGDVAMTCCMYVHTDLVQDVCARCCFNISSVVVGVSALCPAGVRANKHTHVQWVASSELNDDPVDKNCPIFVDLQMCATTQCNCLRNSCVGGK
jgi:hypothetical protein